MPDNGLWIINNKKDAESYLWTLLPLSLLIIIFAGLRRAKNLKPEYKTRLIFLFILTIYLSVWCYCIAEFNWPLKEEDKNNNTYMQSDYNFYMGFSTLPIVMFVLWITLSMIHSMSKTLVSWSNNKSFYICLLSLLLGYTFTGATYYLETSSRNNGLPLHGNFNKVNSKITEPILYTGAGVLGFSGLVGIAYSLYRLDKWRKNKTSVGTTNNKFRILAIGTVLLSLVLFSIYGILANINKNSYTEWLITTNFLILFSLILCLGINYSTNFDSRKDDKENKKYSNYAVIGFSLLACVFSLLNSIFSANQKITNKTDFGTDILKDGQKLNEYKEKSYDYLNYEMTINYISLSFISFAILVFSVLNYYNDKVLFKNLTKFFKFDIKSLEYNRWSILILFTVCALIFITVILATLVANNKTLKWNVDFYEDNFANIVSIVIPLIILGFTLEWGYNKVNDYNKDSKSTFLLKIFQLFINANLFIYPIISLAMYLSNIPEFYEKINNSNANILSAGDLSNKNGIFDINGEFEGKKISQFSTGSNFVSYGNGIFLSGGRSNLDIEVTRDILYIDNQNQYYNFKYLDKYNEGKEINTDFISRNNDDLNLFNLETNDASYGAINNVGDSFWVTVGENVGLTSSDTNNSTIYYNTLAGASTNQTIPTNLDLSIWNKATSGAFDYIGKGVVSGRQTSGDNRWVAVGQDQIDFPSSSFNTIKYSADGKTWTNGTGTVFSGYGNKVAFGISSADIYTGTVAKTNNTYIAVGYDINSKNNNILRSTDGAIWSATTGVSFDHRGTDVAYGLINSGVSGVWVAIGQDSKNPIKYSTDDGSCWLDADNTTYSFAKPDDINSVTYDLKNKNFIVAGKKGTTASVYYSSDGITWNSSAEYDFDNCTAIQYNLKDESTDYNKVFYPPYAYQNYFVKKEPNNQLTYFVIFSFVSTLIIISLFIYMLFRFDNDVKIGDKSKTDGKGKDGKGKDGKGKDGKDGTVRTARPDRTTGTDGKGGTVRTARP